MDNLHKLWLDPILPFHAVRGTGSGSVTYLIRKNWVVWLFRLIRYLEFSRFVTDSRGMPLVFNKLDSEVIPILMRKRKVHAHYDHTGLKEWSATKYNQAWNGSLYHIPGTPKVSFTDAQLIKDPYACWCYGYKAHFVLEKPYSKRKHYTYYKPIK